MRMRRRGRGFCVSVMTVLCLAGVLVAPAGAVTIQSAASGDWDADTTWSPQQIPTSADDVTILDGHTVTVNDLNTHDVANLTIHSGGVLTHESNGFSEQYKLILNVATNLTIDAGGAIDVKGKGFAGDHGPGQPPGSSGAGHGGVGGVHSGAPGSSYGSVTAPDTLGSGGSTETAGGAGGGAAILTVGQATTIHGDITADGEDASYYTGSGGTVFLTTGTLAGTGTLSANGCLADSHATGSGGRIAVILTGSTDFGGVVMRAYGGDTKADHQGKRGAAGTIYLQHTNHVAGRGIVLVDNDDVAVGVPSTTFTLQKGDGASSNAFSEIIVTNGGVYGLDADDTLNISSATVHGDPDGEIDGIYVNGGTLTTVAAFAWTNFFIGVDAGAGFSPATSLTVGTNAQFIVNGPHTTSCHVALQPGAGMTHSRNGNAENYKIDLTVIGDLDVQTGATIDVDGKGHSSNQGPGGAGSNSGGGYGGVGGYHPSSPNPGGVYGSITAPTHIGSGGNHAAAYGGGAVILRVTGQTWVNGTIVARENDEGDPSYRGSGGTVFLTTGSLEGNGLISVRTRDKGYCPGGGGRLSVVLTNGNTFGSVTLEASGGSGNREGGAGTIYTQTRDQGPSGGTLLIDGNGVTPGALASTLIDGNVSNTVVGSVIITNSAKFKIADSQTLTVNGDWRNHATFIGTNAGATVHFASARAATVAGDSTFRNLTAGEPGKTLTFASGSSNAVFGALTLNGGVLTSAAGAPWYLTLDVTSGTQSIAAVTVKDSDASGGQTLTAAIGSTDLGGNVNWVFLAPQGTTISIR